MNFKRCVFIFGIFLISLFFLLYLLEDNITGNLSYEPAPVFNCSSSEQLALWDEIFEESSVGVVILNEDVGVGEICNEYGMYKDGGEVAWYLWKDIDGREITALYFNFTNASYFVAPTSYANFEVSVFVDILGQIEEDIGVNEFYNLFENVNNSVGAKALFDSKFSLTNSSPFVLYDDEFWSSREYDINSSYWPSELKSNELYVNLQPFIFYFNHHISNSIEIPRFIDNISNFTFLMDSDWNYAFNLEDYVPNLRIFLRTLPGEASFFWNYTGAGNENGTLINFTFDGYDVEFKPATNYTGSLEFIIGIYLNYLVLEESNRFTVNIIENIIENSGAPILIGVIPTILLNLGESVVIDLSDYFSDPDGDVITYSGPTIEGITFNFTEDLMKVSLAEDYGGGNISFKINASDGDFVRRSNTIFIFVGAESGEINNSQNGNDSSSVGSGSSGPSNVSVGSSAGEESFDGWWWVIILLVLLCIGIIGVIIYFIKFHKKIPAQKDSKLVGNYLNKLDPVAPKGAVAKPMPLPIKSGSVRGSPPEGVFLKTSQKSGTRPTINPRKTPSRGNNVVFKNKPSTNKKIPTAIRRPLRGITKNPNGASKSNFVKK